MINVKAMPTRFEGKPVVKAAQLVSDESQMPYRSIVITLDESSDSSAPSFNWYALAASLVDGKWTVVNSGYDYSKVAADMKFREYEQQWG